jgi:hypothetical protein
MNHPLMINLLLSMAAAALPAFLRLGQRWSAIRQENPLGGQK